MALKITSKKFKEACFATATLPCYRGNSTPQPINFIGGSQPILPLLPQWKTISNERHLYSKEVADQALRTSIASLPNEVPI